MPRRFTLIINDGSGHDDKNSVRQRILDRLHAAGCEVEVAELESGCDIGSRCAETIKKARDSGRMIIAAGGDGTVNTVASLCHATGTPFGIVPLGTFNYFARGLEIPLEVEAAADVLASAPLHDIDAGMVGDKLFLVNASIGLYVDVIRNREKHKSRFGRYRIVALLSAFLTFVQSRKIFTLNIDTQAGAIRRRTQMLFVGNNRFQLENLGLAGADKVDAGNLLAAVLKPVSRWQGTRLIVLGLLGRMHLESRIEEFAAPAFTVDSARKRLHAVIDGEIASLETPLHFRLMPGALQVIAPLRGAA